MRRLTKEETEKKVPKLKELIRKISSVADQNKTETVSVLASIPPEVPPVKVEIPKSTISEVVLEVKQEILVPVIVNLNPPHPGDGVTGVAYRGGTAWCSDGGLATWHAQGRSQLELSKQIAPGLR